MADELTVLNIGFDFKKNKSFNWYKYVNNENQDLNKFWLATKLSKNIGDISQLGAIPKCDLLTYSFPCTDISVAGKMKGINENTSSGLLYQVERILNNSEKPKFLLMENVKNLVSKKFKPQFDDFLKRLEDMGYINHWQVVNATDCGIPQNRERVFCLSIRKDIYNGFQFAEKYNSGLTVKDLLETEVDDKYKITDGILEALNKKGYNNDTGICNNPRSREYHGFKEVSPTLCARDYKDPKLVQVGNLTGEKWDKNFECRKRVYAVEGISPTIQTSTIPNITLNQVGNLTGGKWDKTYESLKRVYDENGLSPTLTTFQGGNTETKFLTENIIRKITPTEAWKLMGFNKTDIDKCYKMDLSDSQLYKQAGNSIVVDCLQMIFNQIYKFYVNK